MKSLSTDDRADVWMLFKLAIQLNEITEDFELNEYDTVLKHEIWQKLMAFWTYHDLLLAYNNEMEVYEDLTQALFHHEL